MNDVRKGVLGIGGSLFILAGVVYLIGLPHFEIAELGVIWAMIVVLTVVFFLGNPPSDREHQANWRDQLP